MRSNGTTYGHTTINTPDAFHVRVQFEEGRRVGTHVDYVVNEGMRASAEQMYTPGAPVVVRYKASKPFFWSQERKVITGLRVGADSVTAGK